MCSDIPSQIKHSAVCTNVQAFLNIRPRAAENPTENVSTFMSHTEVYERKGGDASLQTFHYLQAASERGERQYWAETQEIQVLFTVQALILCMTLDTYFHPSVIAPLLPGLAFFN